MLAMRYMQQNPISKFLYLIVLVLQLSFLCETTFFQGLEPVAVYPSLISLVTTTHRSDKSYSYNKEGGVVRVEVTPTNKSCRFLEPLYFIKLKIIVMKITSADLLRVCRS